MTSGRHGKKGSTGVLEFARKDGKVSTGQTDRSSMPELETYLMA
jgi:hypothetical protein